MVPSTARREPGLSSHDSIEPRCEELIASGLLSPIKDGYRIERDWVFGTPRAAAAIVSGSSANGSMGWKNCKAQTLDEV